MSPDDRGNDRPPPAGDVDTGERIRELEAFELVVSVGFLGRVRRGISRRLVGSQLLSLSWHGPAVVLREFLEMVFGLVGSIRRRKGGSK